GRLPGRRGAWCPCRCVAGPGLWLAGFRRRAPGSRGRSRPGRPSGRPPARPPRRPPASPAPLRCRDACASATPFKEKGKSKKEREKREEQTPPRREIGLRSFLIL